MGRRRRRKGRNFEMEKRRSRDCRCVIYDFAVYTKHARFCGRHSQGVAPFSGMFLLSIVGGLGKVYLSEY